MSTLRSLSPNPSHSSSSYSPNPNPAAQPSLLAFFGGTAFNGVVKDLKTFTTRFPHVLPISDDGGSTAEIVRVLGGPVVGDSSTAKKQKKLTRTADEALESKLDFDLFSERETRLGFPNERDLIHAEHRIMSG